ncbi:exonuclease domain-containing protein [Pseudarthrobacter sp. P1]|uniref:exonuclease domain-containing protein n=1 Tax=Pseudarthrobacter sp. P1 TaxID=3418418 RepID=UPI003CED0B70
MPLDFTAIDFETANGFRGSPCSVGLVKVRDGLVVDEAYWLMRPPAGHDHFDPRNMQIHGITSADVAAAPRFAGIYPQLEDFIGTDTVVAHNAAFDVGVIRSALEVSGLPGPAFDYACTVVLSRRSYSLPSYSLPFVAEAAGVALVNHHDAVEDARACAGIMVDIARRHGAGSVAGVFGALGLAVPRQHGYDPAVDELSKPTRAALLRAQNPEAAPPAFSGWPDEGANPEANLSADPAHPLFGQTVVFTGNLGLPRGTAKARAAELGAQPASNVTRKTTVLVVGGGFAAADLRSGRVTSKARRVLDLQQRGQGIEVLSEGEFMQMIA